MFYLNDLTPIESGLKPAVTYEFEIPEVCTREVTDASMAGRIFKYSFGYLDSGVRYASALQISFSAFGHPMTLTVQDTNLSTGMVEKRVDCGANPDDYPLKGRSK